MKFLLVLQGKDILGGNELKIVFSEEDDWQASNKADDIEEIWAGHLHHDEYSVRLFRLIEIDINNKEISSEELDENMLINNA